MRDLDQPAKLNDRAVADAREQFLSRDRDPDPQVRRMILASWKRSRENDVGIDRIRVPYVRDPDLEAPLCRSAAPILDTLGEQLQNESISIILTDHTGLVLDRRCSGHDITTRLDEVRLAPGFSYAEEFAGTNGIGTSLSSGRATLVDGREHYNHELGQFACAGAPIKHPTRGKIIGLLDLTAWSHAPGAILTALASATAKQIEEELLAQTGLRELALFSDYMRNCQQSTGPVLALNNDVVMTNSHLRQLLDSTEQAALISYALDTMRVSHETMRTIELPSGRSAHLRFLPTQYESAPAGGVFRIRIGPRGVADKSGARPAVRSHAATTLPGLVGSGAAWVRCAQQVDACYNAGDWVALEGEPGVGKRALLRAVHRLHNPAGHLRVMEKPQHGEFDTWFATLAEDLYLPDALIVLADVGKLDEAHVTAIGDLLAEASNDPDRPAMVAMTINPGEPNPLRSAFPRTIEIPPLRHHLDDLAALVPFLLAQISGGAGPTLSSAAMSQLGRLNWPGNVAQLRKMLTDVVKVRRSGVIEVSDLPPEGRATGHRRLNQIETIERDAIITALLDNDENPTRAAAAIGMSRATVYRKLRRYGISLPLTR